MSSKVASSSASISERNTATDDPGLGTLVTIPREIRDEIYRYLVKGRVLLYHVLNHDHTGMIGTAVLEPTTEKSGLAICQVSKTTHDEATSIFYSESVFRYRIDSVFKFVTFPQAPASNRMMKIELEFDYIYCVDHWYDSFRSAIEHVLKDTVDKFASLGSLRNTLLIKFRLVTPEIHHILSKPFFRRLKGLVGFHTVIMDVGPRPYVNTEKHRWEGYERTAQAIKEEMVPTMGPAIVSQVDLHTYLEFHPLEHMRGNLRALVEKLQIEMDKLDSGADGLEDCD